MSNNQTGSLSLFALGVLFLLSLIILESFLSILTATQWRKEVISGERTSLKNYKEVLTSLENSTQKEILCQNSSNNKLALCRSFNHDPTESLIEGELLTSLSLFPQIDYNQIFRENLLCPKWISTPLNTNSRPRKVSPLISNQTCNPSISSLATNFTMQSNLQIDTLLRIISTDNVTIAALGSLKMRSIESTGNLLLVAGGDISIETLSTLQPNTSVTIVSATGDVTISKVPPNVLLRVIAYGRAFVPKERISVQNNLLPPPLPVHVLGVQESD